MRRKDKRQVANYRPTWRPNISVTFYAKQMAANWLLPFLPFLISLDKLGFPLREAQDNTLKALNPHCWLTLWHGGFFVSLDVEFNLFAWGYNSQILWSPWHSHVHPHSKQLAKGTHIKEKEPQKRRIGFALQNHCKPQELQVCYFNLKQGI